MEKGRTASAMWPAEHEERGRPAGRLAGERAGYLRVVAEPEPEPEPVGRNKAGRWIREGNGRDGEVLPLPSAQAWASEDQDALPPAMMKPALEAQTPQRIIRPWSDLLERALELEIFPRLLKTCRAAAEETAPEAAPSGGELDAFMDFILADDMTGARAVVQDILRRSIGRAALLDDLFAPAARRLGVLWEQDLCDFATVTLGILRLDQMMHETDGDELVGHPVPGHDRRALLMPVPGEQHNFGVSMLSDVFRRGGWHVWSGNATSRPELLRLVRREAFHVIGFSAATQRLVGLLPSCIRAVRRASRNPEIRVLVGGKYFLDNPGEAAAMGADATARDARDALSCADRLVSEMGSVDRQVSA